MYLKEIALEHFRNYAHEQVKFSKKINIFIGDNAQGKTNLLESIYFLALTRSHRTAKDRDLIAFDSDWAKVSGRVVREQTSEVPLEIYWSSAGKIARSNHLERKKLSDYVGLFNVIMFAPEDLALVKGSPAVRRSFIDRELGQMDAIYLHHLSQYQKILKQRNEYLKQLRARSAEDYLYLDILTEQLAAEASHVLKRRQTFTEQLEEWAAPIAREISKGREALQIIYETSATAFESEDTLYEELLAAYKEQQGQEVRRGTTLLGPHRDDLTFLVNDKNVQQFGSQGQQRTTALSVKLAEIELMHKVTGEYPVLLLDDVLSELDDERQTHLLRFIENKVQTFLTTTSTEGVQLELLDSPAFYTIESGRVTSIQASETLGSRD